jgi:hypothetical protein
MVGALQFIEEHLGELWGHNKSDNYSEEEEDNYDKFMLARDKILNQGNTEIEKLKYKGRNQR